VTPVREIGKGPTNILQNRKVGVVGDTNKIYNNDHPDFGTTKTSEIRLRTHAMKDANTRQKLSKDKSFYLFHVPFYEKPL
jgi:esterase/lipase superfamily enzyme